MRVGELFAGIGGASLAVGMVYPDAETVWQADLVNEAVRRRHFPGAAQLVGDVRDVDPARLPRVDLLTAGFPCTDLSVAGKQAGLDGPASGLYSEVLRFTKAQRPERVLIENVPALLGYIGRLSADFRALGYGLTWTVCEAADAGLPHLRRRVFVLAELDRSGRGAVEVDQAGRWQGDRTWPTPTVCGNDNRIGASPTSGDGLGTAVRLWPTVLHRDHKQGGGGANMRGTPPLSAVVQGRRLSAAWVEALMGYPLGWTEPKGATLHTADIPPPVRGRYPVGWDRSVPWPGFDWEPARTLPDGVKAPWRVPRLKGLGNAWAPAQGALALRALLAPAQASLFGAR